MNKDLLSGLLCISYQVRASSIDLLSDSSSSSSDFQSLTKLHFQLRLRAKDFSGVAQLSLEAQRITEFVQGEARPTDHSFLCGDHYWSCGVGSGPHFGSYMKEALQMVSSKFDGDRIVRFGWMDNADIRVINAVVIFPAFTI